MYEDDDDDENLFLDDDEEMMAMMTPHPRQQELLFHKKTKWLQEYPSDDDDDIDSNNNNSSDDNDGHNYGQFPTTTTATITTSSSWPKRIAVILILGFLISINYFVEDLGLSKYIQYPNKKKKSSTTTTFNNNNNSVGDNQVLHHDDIDEGSNNKNKNQHSPMDDTKVFKSKIPKEGEKEEDEEVDKEEEEEEGDEEEEEASSYTFYNATLNITKGFYQPPSDTFHGKRNKFKEGEEFCEIIRSLNLTAAEDDPFVLLKITSNNCKQDVGTGNELHHLMDRRLAAYAEGKTAFLYDCGTWDAFEQRSKLIKPWLSGYFPPSIGSFQTIMTPFYVESKVTGTRVEKSIPVVVQPYDNNICPWPKDYMELHQKLLLHDEKQRSLGGGVEHLPLQYYYPIFRHELRRMAIALVGSIQDRHHPSYEYEQSYLVPEYRSPPYTPMQSSGIIHRVPIHDYFDNGPIFPKTEIDDVAIHFRCGDALKGACCYFTFAKYEEYAKLISPEAKTIGIVTQPFSSSSEQSRTADKLDETGDRCRALVVGLIDYLKPKFPNATFAIRNDHKETIALAWARLIMANQSIALTPSTFSLFPILSNFGTGYIAKLSDRQQRAQYGWITPPKNGHYGHGPALLGLSSAEIVDINYKNKISGEQIDSFWTQEGGREKLMRWFRDENYDLEE